MPSTIMVTHDQLRALADLEEDVVLNELPPGADSLEAWVMLEGDQYRSIIMDEEGNVLTDTVLNET